MSELKPVWNKDRLSEPAATLQPGRELDALVAERVMGYTILSKDPGSNLIFYDYRAADKDGKQTVHKYSTDIAAAWLVVDNLKKKGIIHEVWGDDEKEQAKFYIPDESFENWKAFYAEADTAAHAICLAALKAVGAIA